MSPHRPWRTAAGCVVALLAPLSITAAPVRAADAKKPDTITNSIGMKLTLIPAGQFLMGSPESEQDRNVSEKQHTVRISRPFYLGVYAVTQAEYEPLMGSNPSCFSPKGDGKEDVGKLDTGRFPVETLAWNDAQEFCRRLTKKEGKKYRLPTEAEWEYACRAGTTTAFCFGPSVSSTQANFDGTYPYLGGRGPFLRRTTTVGSYAANAFGLYDMHGNVYQWCSDWYGADYYGQSPADDPRGPAAGTHRVVRGGSWLNFGVACRSANRPAFDPASRDFRIGFRVVRER